MVLSAVRIRKRRRNEASSSETWAAPRSISATMPEKPANATAAARKASKRSGTEMVMSPAALRPLPLDLDSAGFGAGQGVQLFDADTRRLHAGIFETRDRDALGQGLGEVDVARCQNGADFLGNGVIVDDQFELVGEVGLILHRQIDVDAHRLHLPLFVAMHADMRQDLEVADEDVTDGQGCIGNGKARDVRTGHGASEGSAVVPVWPRMLKLGA